MNRTIILSISLIIFVTVVLLMITGSPILLAPVIREPYVPLGNLLTWLGFISLPILLLKSFKGLNQPTRKLDKVIRKGLLVILIMALLWGLIGYALAGNWANNFGNQEAFRGSYKASRWFWTYNYFLIIGPFLLLLVYVILGAINRRRGNNSF